MNIVILQGRLTHDPEISNNNGISYLNFFLAIGRPYKNTEGLYEADFVNCTASGRTAELIAQYVKKGNMLGVEGSWRTGSYVNKDGVTIYTNKCQVQRIHLQPRNSSISDNETPSTNIPVKTGRTNGYAPVQPEAVNNLPKENDTPEENYIPQAFDISMDDEFPF